MKDRTYKLGYLAEEISKQSVKAVAWFLFTAYSKMQEERDKLKKVLNKKEPEFEDLANSQPIHSIKTEKVCSGENTKDVAGQSFHKEITHGFKQPAPQWRLFHCTDKDMHIRISGLMYFYT